MTQYLRAHYNFNDPACISIIDDLSFWSAPFGMKLLNAVRYKKNIYALDIGCGLGFPLMELAMRLGSSSKVYGLDPWSAGMERIALKCKYTETSNVELVQGVAEAMPFENDFFSLLVSNNGLNNVQDLPKVLSECNRVSRMNAQCVFTFNTDQTFVEFYDVFREVLREERLLECEKKIDAHIYSKRKPLAEFEDILDTSGFQILKIDEDKFSYHFSDGSSLFNHFTMKMAFLDPWKDIVPLNLQEDIFNRIEKKLNSIAEKKHGFSLTVPFMTIDCEKRKQI